MRDVRVRFVFAPQREAELSDRDSDANESFEIEQVDGPAQTELYLSGRLSLRSGAAIWNDLKKRISGGATAYRVDMTKLEYLDGAAASLLLAARGVVQERGGTLEFSGMNQSVQTLLQLYEATEPPKKPPPTRIGLLDQIGNWAVAALEEVQDVLSFLGRTVVATRQAVRTPSSVNWAAIPQLMEKAGADGVPIVLLINFLIGLILAIQSAIQLQTFGAGIYLADLMGQSICRELAPLMTAVVVTGRSGAAYAAELGTMTVSEEVDALKTLGQDPMRYLVLPRTIALVCMVPLLTILGDFIGVFGGLVVAMSKLDMTAVLYMNRIQESLDLWAVGGGLIKSVAFAAAISMISCQRGLQSSGGAAGVGSSTTRAVVVCLLVIVALDGVFTTIFNIFNI